jgi:predicted small lipoprotein YifL
MSVKSYTSQKNASGALFLGTLLIGLSLLTACGQRGPLYLPDEPQKTAVPETVGPMGTPEIIEPEQAPGTTENEEKDEEKTGT